MSALREWAASAGGGAHKVRACVCYMHGPNKVVRLQTWSPLTVTQDSVHMGLPRNRSLAERVKDMGWSRCHLLRRASLL